LRTAPSRRGSWPLHLFILVYLALQLGFPIRGLVVDKLANRGNFSWNMYAHDYECSVAYTAHATDGTVREIDFEGVFRNKPSSTKLLHRDSLPRLHAWLCAGLANDERLAGLVSCRLNGGRWTDLVDPTADLCALDQHGGQRP
jgi:hypothetical protein